MTFYSEPKKYHDLVSRVILGSLFLVMIISFIVLMINTGPEYKPGKDSIKGGSIFKSSK